MVEAGQVLNGRYELREELGRGGMAQVFRAVDRQLEREVAVKVLPPSFAHEERFVERFRREARSSASLNHPNIVGVYDSGLDGQLHFIVMELVNGPSLSQVVEDVGRVDLEHSLDLAIQVARALEVAHEQGIVHRDIKPSNILFNEEGVAKVSDFGIARVLADATEAVTDTVFGSVRYIAPEQAQARPVDERADVYALGCVLYEMLTGSAPFNADMPVAVLHQHMTRPPDPPSQHVEDLPADADAVVLHALQKERDDRYPSAEAFRADLERLQEGRPPLLPVAGDGDIDETRAIRRVDETVAMGAVPGADRTERLEAVPAGGGGTGPREPVVRHGGDEEGPAWWVWVVAFVALGLLIAVLLILMFFGGPGGGGGEDEPVVPVTPTVPETTTVPETPTVPETTTVRTDEG